MLTVHQAATALGITPGAVRALLARGLLSAKKFGNQWAITEQEIERYNATRRKAGRPRKQAPS